MTNYDKKRKRQNGRQKSNESERSQQYRQGYFDGQSALIERLTQAGILPPITFDLKQVSQEEFKNDYTRMDRP